MKTYDAILPSVIKVRLNELDAELTRYSKGESST